MHNVIRKDLQKGTHFCKTGCLSFCHLFVSLRPVAEGGQGHPAGSGRLGTADLAGAPLLAGQEKVVGQGLWRPAEPYSAGLSRRDALRLPPADVVPLVLRHEGEHL